MKKLTSLVVALCATTLAFATATGTKVTDPATLKTGDKIAITSYDGKKAMSTEQTSVVDKSFYRGVVSFDASNVTSDVEQVELVASGDNWKLKVTGGFLAINNDEKNWLATNETGTEWSFVKNGDTIQVQAVSGANRIILYNYNGGEPRFAAYKKTSGAYKDGQVSIYKIEGEAQEKEVEEVSVSDALDIIEALADGGSSDKYIVKGIVSQILTSDEDLVKYKNCDFWIRDIDNASDKVKAFRINGIGGGTFDVGTIAVGDTVKVKGPLCKYVKDKQMTPEVNTGELVEVIKGEGGGEGEGEEIKGLVYAEAYWDTEYEYWEFDLYKDYNESTSETVYPEVYFAVEGGSETTIVGTEYDAEYDYGYYVKSKGDTIWFTDAEISIVCIGEGEYRISGTFVGDDSNEYSFELAAEVYAYACTWNETEEEYDYEDIYLEDVPTAVRSIEIDENVYARDGRIYAEEGARIYTLNGLDVTRQNGSLNGVYVVRTAEKVATVIVRK